MNRGRLHNRLRGQARLVLGLTASLLLLAFGPAIARDCEDAARPIPSLYANETPFRDAIEAADTTPAAATKLSGITVPHHLLAAHLIARGFEAASDATYRRVIVLFPDHFRATRGMFATISRDFETVFGRVDSDEEAVEALAAVAGAPAVGAEACLFAEDHGLQAMLPFIRHHFPDARIVPLAISIRSKRKDWEAAAAALAPLLDDDTLVVQSTDFSHYLPHYEARRHDQQTLNLIAAGTFDQIALLRQPDHVDSLGALYIQLKLQRGRAGTTPLVVANENQQQYDPLPVAETTSYVVIQFGRFPDDMPAPDAAKTRFLYLAGDTSFARAMQDALLREPAAERVAEAVLRRTGGRPLAVNLEGVILPNVPAGIDDMTLAMPQDLAIAWLKRLNVAAVSLANNHALDLGEQGLSETRRALDEAGIIHAGQGETIRVAGVDLVALTDLDVNGSYDNDLITADLLAGIANGAGDRPLVVMVHWGREYSDTPGPREKFLAEALARRAVSGIFGGHSHVASSEMQALAGGDALHLYSLGNFLFDQTAEKASGAIVELRIFEQGTFFGRLMPLPNLFDLAQEAAGQQVGISSGDR